MRAAKLIMLLLGIGGCATRQPAYTFAGQEIVQKQITLYRQKPHLWLAKGRLVATAEELVFIPTPHFGALYLHGRDSTFIPLNEVARLEEKKWLLLFPFKLNVITQDGSSYTFVSVRRDRLAKEINRLRRKE